MTLKSLPHASYSLFSSSVTYFDFDSSVAILSQEKISKGKISKFLNDNSLLNQLWIMDPKKTVKDILKENSKNKEIKVLDYIRYKVGEGV